MATTPLSFGYYTFKHNMLWYVCVPTAVACGRRGVPVFCTCKNGSNACQLHVWHSLTDVARLAIYTRTRTRTRAYPLPPSHVSLSCSAQFASWHANIFVHATRHTPHVTRHTPHTRTYTCHVGRYGKVPGFLMSLAYPVMPAVLGGIQLFKTIKKLFINEGSWQDDGPGRVFFMKPDNPLSSFIWDCYLTQVRPLTHPPPHPLCLTLSLFLSLTFTHTCTCTRALTCPPPPLPTRERRTSKKTDLA